MVAVQPLLDAAEGTGPASAGSEPAPKHRVRFALRGRDDGRRVATDGALLSRMTLGVYDSPLLCHRVAFLTSLNLRKRSTTEWGRSKNSLTSSIDVNPAPLTEWNIRRCST